MIRDLSGLANGDLQAAYRAAVKRWHPDLNSGDQTQYDRLQAAWDALRGAVSAS